MGTRQKLNLICSDNQEIFINETILSKVNMFKYLEVTIDKSLTWEAHIHNL